MSAEQQEPILCVFCDLAVEVEKEHVYADNRYAHLRCYFEEILKLKCAEKPKVIGIRLAKGTREKKQTDLERQSANLDALLSVINKPSTE